MKDGEETMGKCVIFCAGGFAGLIQPIGEEDYVIAADGHRHPDRHPGLVDPPQLHIKPRSSLKTAPGILFILQIPI